MLASFRRGAWLVLAVMTIALPACEALTTQDDNDPTRRLIYGLTLLPSGFDPHINASFELGIPFMSVYDTLVYRHPETQAFEPGLAERWEISDDGTRYTFYLRQGVTFHDGEPLTANAVAVNFDRISAEDTASQKAALLLGPNYSGYTIVDDFTFEINLTAPYDPLLDALSQVYFGIASPLALANHQDGTYQWNQVGTGPYRLQEVVPGDRIILERNPDYTWGPPFYTVDNPNPIEEVEFRFFTDPPTRDDALVSGQVGMLGELLPIDAELLLGNSEISLYPTPIPGQPLQFIMNTQRFPTDRRATRQALLYATNRAAIVDAVFAGQSPVAFGPLSSITPTYNPDVESLYVADPDRSVEILERENIFDSDDDGILDLQGAPLELTILVPPWGLIPETAQALAGQWRAQGFVVEIEQVPNFPELLARADEGDYNLIAMYDFGLDPSILNSYFLSNGTNNFSGYQNPELDDLLLRGLAERETDARNVLYGQAQMQIMEEALILPVREYINLNGATHELDGVIFDAHGWWPLLNNFQWAEE
ncbi:MAG: ABC transporter substrate-binding protein [Anaerolineales bacterium]